MIITKLKDTNEILRLLEGKKNVFIVGCGSCAEACRTGGQEDVEKMAQFLKGKGKKVVGWTIPEETCQVGLVKKNLREQKDKLEDAQAVLVMSCGAGVQSVEDFTDILVCSGCDTMFLGNTMRIGDFKEFCSMCGECKLADYSGLCPVTRCPKGMLNGPCGGMNEGKCEVNNDRDCVWILIYEKLKKMGKVARFKEYHPPQKHSLHLKPMSHKVKHEPKRKV